MMRMKRPKLQLGNFPDRVVPRSNNRSGDNVRYDAVGNQLDLVLQGQLLLLHPGELKLIAVAAYSQQFNFLVETPMLGLEKRQHLPRIVVIHAPVLQESRFAVTFVRSTANRSARKPYGAK